MDFFSGERHKFDVKRCFDFSQISKSCKAHLRNVYACVTLALFVACVGAAFHVHFKQGAGSVGLLPLIGSLGSLIYLGVSSRPGFDGKRLGALMVFGLCNGLSLGPLVGMVMQNNPAIVVSALLYTTLLFCSLTLVALYSQKRSLLFIGGFVLAGLQILFWTSILRMFFGWSLLSFGAEIWLGLVVFCGFVLFDTQMIIYRHEALAERDFIWHSVDLFMDFINIFIRILIILSNKEEKKSNKRR